MYESSLILALWIPNFEQYKIWASENRHVVALTTVRSSIKDRVLSFVNQRYAPGSGENVFYPRILPRGGYRRTS